MSELPKDAVAHPARVVAGTVAAVGVGVTIATQTRINGELGARLGDGFTAAIISFGSGLVLVAVVTLMLPSGRRGMARIASALRQRRMPWWYVLGGAGGATFVLGQGLLGALLGVALFTIGIVAGQVASSLLIDRRGIGTMPARRITPQRFVGSVLAVLAVAIAGSGELHGRLPLALVLVPVAIGLVIGAQPALNGQLRVIGGSAAAATTVNFVVGTAILAVIALVHAGVAGWPTTFPTAPWLYAGGIVGAVFIAVQTIIVRVLGALLMGLAMLAGQLAAAVLFDLLLPLPGDRLTFVTVVGAVVTLLAVGVVAIPSRRREVSGASSGTASR